MQSVFNLQEALLEQQQGVSSQFIGGCRIAHLEPSRLEFHLNDAIDALTDDVSRIRDDEIFGILLGAFQLWPEATLASRHKLGDVILSACRLAIKLLREVFQLADKDEMYQEKDMMERIVFLMQMLVSVAERGEANAKAVAAATSTTGKKTKASTVAFDWPVQREQTFFLLRDLSNLTLNRVWVTAPERDVFINLVTKLASLVMEQPTILKQATVMDHLNHILCICVKKYNYNHGIKTLVLQNLNYFEHLADPMAEMLAVMIGEYETTSVTESVLSEIARMNFATHETSHIPKTFSRFLVRLAELAPKEVLKAISLLIEHLDGDSYVIRCAMIDVLGRIISNYLINDTSETGRKQLTSFFTIIEERYRDVNAHVRCRVLQVVEELCSVGALLLQHRSILVQLTRDRLHDKNSNVRKRAMQLLGELMRRHPFFVDGGELNKSVFEKKLVEVEAQIQAAVPDAIKNQLPKTDSNETMEVEETTENKEDDIVKDEDILNDDIQQDAASSAPQSVIHGMNDAAQQAIAPLLLKRKYYLDALEFIEEMHQAVTISSQLLDSTIKTEILDAMDFLVSANLYQLAPAKLAIRKMLHLIWTRDNAVSATEEDGTAAVNKKSIREYVVQAYKKLFMEIPCANIVGEKERAQAMALQWINLTADLSLAELTSLEALVALMAQRELFPASMRQTLWAVYGTLQSQPAVRRRGAILLLTMMLSSTSSLESDQTIAERVQVLLRVGLGEHGQEDPVVAKYSCMALHRLLASVESSATANYRLPNEHLVITSLVQFLEAHCPTADWFGVIEEGIHAIYILALHPDVVLGDWIRRMSVTLFQVESESHHSVSCMALAKFFLVIGHVAIKQLAHLEVIENHWKTHQQEHQKKNVSKLASKSNTNELEKVTGSVEDEFSDVLTLVREKELLFGEKSLLSVYGPMVAQLCANNKDYSDITLQTMANLCLCKYMCVSSEYCEQHLQLLLTLLERSTHPVMRANMILALGDMALCFNHLIDENISYLYDRLRDSDLSVRMNALMVLTHLILNGMIKVKGQLFEMAKCLEDKETRISDLAKMFFSELSARDNAIYNNLPDVISHLSVAVDEQKFASIMRYIFSFVKKEKQSENMVEKLCQRFHLATDQRQWRDIAFCLSLLPFGSERSLKKLVESFSFYHDKLSEPFVFHCFMELISKAKKSQKAEMKQFLDEFEVRVVDCHEKGLAQDSEGVILKKKGTAKVSNNAANGEEVPKKKRTVKKKTQRYSDDSDGDIEMHDQEPVAASAVQRTARSTRKSKKVIDNDDDDDLHEQENLMPHESDQDVPPPSQPVKKASKKVFASSDSEDNWTAKRSTRRATILEN